MMKLKIAVYTLLFFCPVFVVSSNAQTDNPSNTAGSKKQERPKDKENAKDDKDCPESATVRLRVTFDKSGEVTKTVIVSSGGCKFFDEKALEAAKEIKFEPKTRNGKKTTVVKLVEYTFNKDY